VNSKYISRQIYKPDFVPILSLIRQLAEKSYKIEHPAKRDSSKTGNSHLSSPVITGGIKRHFPFLAKKTGHDLAFR